MKKILLTGSDGQLGTDILEVFRDSNTHEIIPWTLQDVDLTDTPKLKDKLKKLPNISWIINCAALTNTAYCEENPTIAFSVNAKPLEALSLFSKKNDIKLIHISTDYVFDGETNTPYTESDSVNPINAYGKSKLAGENFIREKHDKYFIFRVSSLFGIHGPENFLEKIINFSKEKDEISVVSDQIISPTHTMDVSRIIYNIIKDDFTNYGLYHLTSGGETSWFDFAKELFKLLEITTPLKPISVNDFPAKLKRPEYSVLDTSNLNQYYKINFWKKALKEYTKRKEDR